MDTDHVARYRLRFLLQEFDLRQGVTLIGRSPECHVTIEDPLVSRRHARVSIEGDRAEVEDLGSRNGLRINGKHTKGRSPLADGDRIRIGTQELVFCRAGEERRAAINKKTGFLQHCANCGTPYPEELVSCPSCGHPSVSDEETLSGMLSTPRQNWTLQLLTQVLRKALALGRDDDVHRVMGRVATCVEQWSAEPEGLDREQLDTLATVIGQVAHVEGAHEWAGWAFGVFARIEAAPPLAMLQYVSTLPTDLNPPLLPYVRALNGVLEQRATPLSADEAAAVEALSKLLARLEEGA